MIISPRGRRFPKLQLLQRREPVGEAGSFSNSWLINTVGEYAFLSLVAGYLSAYLFAADQPHLVRTRLGTVPILAWQRLTGADVG